MVRGLIAIFVILLSLDPAVSADIKVGTIEGAAVVVVSGDLSAQDIAQFRTAISSLSKALVVFQSDGGSLVAGIQIGELIRLKNFPTLVPDGFQCASACAIAWLGGTTRFMGPNARVGFHAAYDVRAGRPTETGMGNAVLGAYLNKIGLSTAAIVYITQASPTSMSWLTLKDAEQIGIDVVALAPSKAETAAVPSSPPPAADTLSSLSPTSRGSDGLEDSAINFLNGLFDIWNGTNDNSARRFFEAVYADVVIYYGALKSKEDVLLDKRNFVGRWPERAYKIRPGSLKAQCFAAQCFLTGIVDWQTRNSSRNTSASGTASFRYAVLFISGEFRIYEEKGEVIQRQTVAKPKE